MAAKPLQKRTTIGTPIALQSHSPMLNESAHDHEGKRCLERGGSAAS